MGRITGLCKLSLGLFLGILIGVTVAVTGRPDLGGRVSWPDRSVLPYFWVAAVVVVALFFAPVRSALFWAVRKPAVGLARLIAALWDFFSNPVRAGAFGGMAFAVGLAGVWWLTLGALENAVRPWPIELAGFTAANSAMFLYSGVGWFAVHALAIPFVIGVFRAHRETRTATLWAFTLAMSIAVLLWICFGALSVPLGANAGPHYGDTVEKAQLTERQKELWETPCRPTMEVADVSGRSLEWLSANCVGIDMPLLLADPCYLPGATVESCGFSGGAGPRDPIAEQVSPAQMPFVQSAWALAQDVWVVRKVSDSLYFGGNGFFVFAMLFFCIFVAQSRVLNSFSLTLAAVAGLGYGFGFLGFYSTQYDWVLLVGIIAHVLWLASVSIDLWDVRLADPADAAARMLTPAPIVIRPVDRDVDSGELETIGATQDPFRRNRQITSVYARLARQLDEFLVGVHPGRRSANWCHFAVWASKTAGHYIDKDAQFRDMCRRTLSNIDGYRMRELQPGSPGSAPELDAPNLSDARRVVTMAIAGGNRLVFEEVAPLLIEFLAESAEHAQPKDGHVQAFIEQHEVFDDEGSRLLAASFQSYYDARFEPDKRMAAELVLLGNFQLLAHEQQRLDPYIAEGNGSALLWPMALTFPAPLVRCLYRLGAFPLHAFIFVFAKVLRLGRLNLRERGLEGEQQWLGWASALWTWMFHSRAAVRISDWFWAQTITLRVGNEDSGKPRIIRVGDELKPPDSFAENLLGDLRNQQLLRLLGTRRINPTAKSQAGVKRYRDINDRMRFLFFLLRSYQFEERLRDEPFSGREVEEDGLSMIGRPMVGAGFPALDTILRP